MNSLKKRKNTRFVIVRIWNSSLCLLLSEHSLVWHLPFRSFFCCCCRRRWECWQVDRPQSSVHPPLSIEGKPTVVRLRLINHRRPRFPLPCHSRLLWCRRRCPLALLNTVVPCQINNNKNQPTPGISHRQSLPWTPVHLWKIRISLYEQCCRHRQRLVLCPALAWLRKIPVTIARPLKGKQ